MSEGLNLFIELLLISRQVYSPIVQRYFSLFTSWNCVLYCLSSSELLKKQMDDIVYSLYKDDKYDNFYLGIFENRPQIWFDGIKITPINISSHYCHLYHPPFTKRISKSFYDSVVMILRSARSDVISTINNQTRVESINLRPGSKFYLISKRQIYIVNTLSVSPNGMNSYSTITINTEEFYPTMQRDETGGMISLLERKLVRYSLDDCAYNYIDQKIRQTHQIVYNLLIDKYSSGND